MHMAKSVAFYNSLIILSIHDPNYRCCNISKHLEVISLKEMSDETNSGDLLLLGPPCQKIYCSVEHFAEVWTLQALVDKDTLL